MVEIKHLCLCLLFSSTHFSVYKDTFAFYKDTKCVQGHAILMPEVYDELIASHTGDSPVNLILLAQPAVCTCSSLFIFHPCFAVRYHILQVERYLPGKVITRRSPGVL